MFKNYFKTAFRSFRRNKTFSLLNICGLALGITCCFFIAVYVYDELNYDKYPEKARQIYRVQVNVTGNGGVETYPNVDVAVGEGMKNAFPEIESSTRLTGQRTSFVKYGDKQFKEQALTFADANFFRVFSIPFIKGNAATALAEPNCMVITQAFAKKYFGDDEPMGKSLIVGRDNYKVAGVINKVPDNSHFHFDAFISMSTLHLVAQTWSNIGFYTYVVLNENADPKKLETKFPALVAKYVVPETMHDMGVSLAEAQKAINTFRFFLQPLTGIHLHSTTKYELEANGDIQYVYIFSALAIFILLLACVNFTNLSTASSAKRAREIGVRKVMGSGKKQLVSQFLVESVLLTACAIVFALGVVYLLMPYFNQLSGKHIDLGFFFSGQCIVAILLVGLLVGVLAGIYPAFFLSSFNAVNILKSASSTTTRRKSPLRSGLVVFQFAVSTGLIISTIVVYRQLHYMQEKKLGYNKDQVMYLEDTYVLGARDARNAFKETLAKDSRIISASTGTNIPGHPPDDGTEIYPKDKQSDENGAEIHANIFHIDYDYVSTLGIQIKEGRNFSRDFPTDSFAVVINEAAVHDLGWEGTSPLGKTIVTSGQHEYKVIGVAADFHYVSVKQKIAPLMMELGRTGAGLILKIKTAGIQDLIGDIKKQWNIFNPGAPFAYYFLDNKFDSLYSSERKTGQIFSVFAVLAIVIASLGLFGLVTFITQQRTKEIGIRKVFGASVQQMLVLVAKEFLILVFIAFFIAIPVTWWGMHKWLEDFAYRVSISGWVFIAAGAAAVFIALLTLSFQAIKAAIANPIKSLRTE
ncbi:MAG: ABC transporter permease [Bacteroidota bacterium]|nr:ABC transporter permease [Bacteroidota bacterium]